MGELGDALELHQAPSSFRSFRADIRHWLDPTLWLEASLAFEARGGHVPAKPVDPRGEPQHPLADRNSTGAQRGDGILVR